jgi:hypothetical protein
MLSGGQPREWLELQHDGNKPGVRGSHTGPSEALNIHNAQSGMMYYWARHPSMDRGANLQRKINEGWEVVPPDAPEHKGRENSLNYAQLGLDNYQVHGDLIMCRMPEDRYAEFCKFRDQIREAAAAGPTMEYESKGASLEERFAGRGDGPLYHKRPGHGTF